MVHPDHVFGEHQLSAAASHHDGASTAMRKSEMEPRATQDDFAPDPSRSNYRHHRPSSPSGLLPGHAIRLFQSLVRHVYGRVPTRGCPITTGVFQSCPLIEKVMIRGRGPAGSRARILLEGSGRVEMAYQGPCPPAWDCPPYFLTLLSFPLHFFLLQAQPFATATSTPPGPLSVTPHASSGSLGGAARRRPNNAFQDALKGCGGGPPSYLRIHASLKHTAVCQWPRDGSQGPGLRVDMPGRLSVDSSTNLLEDMLQEGSL